MTDASNKYSHEIAQRQIEEMARAKAEGRDYLLGFPADARLEHIDRKAGVIVWSQAWHMFGEAEPRPERCFTAMRIQTSPLGWGSSPEEAVKMLLSFEALKASANSGGQR